MQQLEEKQEREQFLAYFAQRGWNPEETEACPLPALRRMHQELDPVSYLGNGMPRLSAQSVDDNLAGRRPQIRLMKGVAMPGSDHKTVNIKGLANKHEYFAAVPLTVGMVVQRNAARESWPCRPSPPPPIRAANTL